MLGDIRAGPEMGPIESVLLHGQQQGLEHASTGLAMMQSDSKGNGARELQDASNEPKCGDPQIPESTNDSVKSHLGYTQA